MTIYEYYYDLRYFKMSGFYILVVRTDADTDNEATLKAKELFADFLTNEAQKLRS